MSIENPSPDMSASSVSQSVPKQAVSERKIRANRRNAHRSTGPKTENGKYYSSRNAIKHGLLARQVVIANGLGAEKLEEFHAEVERLQRYYEPDGPIEESLVETIACSMWRKARILRAENGEIRKRLDTAELDLTLRNSDKANLELALAKFDGSFFAGEGRGMPKLKDLVSLTQISQINLRDHLVGLTYLTSLLRIAKSEIVSEGCISKSIRKQIFCGFCLWDYMFAVLIANSDSQEYAMQDPRTGMAASVRDDENPMNLLAYIEEMLGKLRTFAEGAIARQQLAVEAEARSFSLPSTEATDKILRYEAHLDRQLYRAMDQLERLQRQRRGENVPPPLNVNLGRRA